MSILERISRVLTGMKPLLPAFIGVIVLTVAALAFLAWLSRDTWVEDDSFSIAGLFFGLDSKSVLRLSCAWLKLWLPIIYLACFQKLETVQYIVFLVPAVLLVFLGSNIKQIAGSLGWTLLQTAGLVSAGLVYGYYAEIYKGIAVLIIYIAISIFTAVFSIYLFLLELNDISAARKINPSKMWRI